MSVEKMDFRCEKCGWQDIAVRYSHRKQPPSYEVLRCTCNRCQFQWSQVPLNAKPLTGTLAEMLQNSILPKSQPAEEKDCKKVTPT